MTALELGNENYISDEQRQTQADEIQGVIEFELSKYWQRDHGIKLVESTFPSSITLLKELAPRR